MKQEKQLLSNKERSTFGLYLAITGLFAIIALTLILFGIAPKKESFKSVADSTLIITGCVFLFISIIINLYQSRSYKSHVWSFELLYAAQSAREEEDMREEEQKKWTHETTETPYSQWSWWKKILFPILIIASITIFFIGIAALLGYSPASEAFLQRYEVNREVEQILSGLGMVGIGFVGLVMTRIFYWMFSEKITKKPTGYEEWPDLIDYLPKDDEGQIH